MGEQEKMASTLYCLGKVPGVPPTLAPKIITLDQQRLRSGTDSSPSNHSNICSAPSGPTEQLGFHQNHKSSPQNLWGGGVLRGLQSPQRHPTTVGELLNTSATQPRGLMRGGPAWRPPWRQRPPLAQ